MDTFFCYPDRDSNSPATGEYTPRPKNRRSPWADRAVTKYLVIGNLKKNMDEKFSLNFNALFQKCKIHLTENSKFIWKFQLKSNGREILN